MAGKINTKNTSKAKKAKSTAAMNITSSSESNAENGYVSGDRNRSSSSHQFHKDS